MDTASTVLTYVVFGVPAAFVGAYLLALGPVGLFGIAFLVLGAMVVRSFVGNSAAAVPDRTNCEECGSPNPPELDRCDYCDAPLDGE